MSAAKPSNVVALHMADPVALLQQMVAAASDEAKIDEADLPVPPVDSSPKAAALWYSALKERALSLGEMVVLEALVTTQSHLDEVESAWRRDGAQTTSSGSMGQSIVEPRIQEMRLLRQQVAALVKQLDLDGVGRRRAGRPTRSQGGGEWGK
ncbi:hypothetical protein Q9S36_29445 [Microbacterium sp. ARD31]|uniref:hypothetical protein n=1 Tax=Microbacterium sp. ARD31 TaxID=2962576 RepID=UPI0028814FC0|nr:hypothetical protein [Microbacterium sp. ARD31]MDT0184327.1 hypothetical protein [Microbacterium sp. ARD31]